MKLIFAHDHIFQVSLKGDVYSPGKLNNQSFARYLNVFSSVTIVSRAQYFDSKKVDNFNKIDGDKIDFIGIESQSNLINRFIKRNKFKKQLKRLIGEHGALVVRVPSEIGFLAAEVALSLNLPYVCEVVACPKDAMNGFKSLKASLYSPILVSSMKSCVKHAAGALYVTDQFLQSRYPCIGVTKVASNVEIYGVNLNKSIYDIETKSSIQIVLTGHLDSVHKGYDTVYSAAELLEVHADREIEFILIGPGTKYKKEFHKNNVSFIFTGALNAEQVIELLDNADLYIQPSNQEGLPRATIEAMSRALPCVVSNAGGLPELIDNDFVHEVNDYVQLANKIGELISNNELYWQQSKLNTVKAEKFISNKLHTIRNRFFSEYKKLLLKTNR